MVVIKLRCYLPVGRYYWVIPFITGCPPCLPQASTLPSVDKGVVGGYVFPLGGGTAVKS